MTAIQKATAAMLDMKLEVVDIPVSDVDRAKRFHGGLGWRLDADFAVGDSFRVVQLTPPGSPESMGVTTAAPGSARGFFLAELAKALRRAEAAQGEHEKRLGRRDDAWADWYADDIVREQPGGASARRATKPGTEVIG